MATTEAVRRGPSRAVFGELGASKPKARVYSISTPKMQIASALAGAYHARYNEMRLGSPIPRDSAAVLKGLSERHGNAPFIQVANDLIANPDSLGRFSSPAAASG